MSAGNEAGFVTFLEWALHTTTAGRQGFEGTVALRDRRACWITGGGGTIQIASWSSSNAVASRNTGATSTPSS